MASKTFYECGCMEQGDQYFACDQHKADPIVRPMPDQPIDAGKDDRDTAEVLVRLWLAAPAPWGRPGDLEAAVAIALAAARRKGQAQERRQAVRDGFDAGEDFCCGSPQEGAWTAEAIERYRAERFKAIEAVVRAREEPTR